QPAVAGHHESYVDRFRLSAWPVDDEIRHRGFDIPFKAAALQTRRINLGLLPDLEPGGRFKAVLAPFYEPVQEPDHRSPERLRRIHAVVAIRIDHPQQAWIDRLLIIAAA